MSKSDIRKQVEADAIKLAWFNHLYLDKYKPTVVHDYPDEPVEYDWIEMINNAHKAILELEQANGK